MRGFSVLRQHRFSYLVFYLDVFSPVIPTESQSIIVEDRDAIFSMDVADDLVLVAGDRLKAFQTLGAVEKIELSLGGFFQITGEFVPDFMGVDAVKKLLSHLVGKGF
jgi:hypothetical protein